MDAYDSAPREALLHRLLLRSGGLLPAQTLADARYALSQGDLAAVVALVTDGLRGTGGRPAAEDLQLLAGLGATGLDEPGPSAPAGPQQHVFQPVDVDAVPEGTWVPPVVDLTAEGSALRTVAADGTDWAATAAAASLPGTLSVWRAWRVTSSGAGEPVRDRVYLVEVDRPVTELAGHAAQVMATVAAEGVAAPLVEVHAVHTAVPAAFLQARRGAALLWAAEADQPVRIARAFDGVDPTTGPFFTDDHARLEGAEKEAVLRFLENAPVLLSSTETMADILDPGSGRQVSTDHRTDGAWTWTDTVPYYLRTHDLAPDPEFLGAIRRCNYTVGEVTAAGRRRAIAALYLPIEENA